MGKNASPVWGILFFHIEQILGLPYKEPMLTNFHVPYELRMRYLLRKTEELEVCRVQLAERELDAVKTLAHQMRGNAVSFDFPLLEQLGILLEERIESEDIEGTKVLVDDIQRAINGFIQRLEKSELQAK